MRATGRTEGERARQNCSTQFAPRCPLDQLVHHVAYARAKQVVAAEITQIIVKNTGTPAEYIFVIFEDVAPSDWAGGGKLFGDGAPASS
jgi:4-oxalocrotonate tautomerase